MILKKYENILKLQFLKVSYWHRWLNNRYSNNATCTIACNKTHDDIDQYT